MATIHATVHVASKDRIYPQAGGESRWIKIGIDGPAIFASDEKMAELRDAIDAYLAQAPAKAEAA